tara:strand:+ start:281 stop:802 length:522 start_codon:yes stop_codon:yes gene_type:complete
MAFKLKGILNKNVAPALKKNNANIKKMQKLDDEIAKARKLGNKGVVQVLLDKKSKLEDIIMGTTKPPADRPDPTFEGTDEFRKKKDIPKSELKSRGVLRKNGNDKQPPVQPGESKDTEVYEGKALYERINDLEIRIENVNEKYSNYDRPLTAKEKNALQLLKAKLADLKSKRK